MDHKMKTEKTFGMWNSPISAAALSQQVQLEDVQWDSDGQTLVWLEGRSDCMVLVAQTGQEARRDLTSTHLPHGGVGYGGGEFCVHQGKVCFAERSGQLYLLGLGTGSPSALTPEFGAAASPTLRPDGRWAAYVYSDGSTDLLGLVSTGGQEWPVQLARGADFYMQTAWHPSGEMLAWVEWNHPNMPWDGSEVKLARLTGSPPRPDQIHSVGGGATLPASQPAFSPDGRWLAFVEANDEWENLVLLDLQDNSRHVLVEGIGYHLGLPAWTQGQRSIGWRFDSRALYFISNASGRASLQRADLDGTITPIDTVPYTWIQQLSVSPANDQLAFIASSPSTPTCLIRWDGQRLQVVARSESESIDPAYLPQPQAIEWTTTDGDLVHGIYYPVSNPEYLSSGLPPVIVNIHGGPTAGVPIAYAAETSYFTSRGYACVEVNYRGSTGYGRRYREALRGNWGLADVEDAVRCPSALARMGLADERRSIIKGGSAGGYTVLNALVHHPGTFKAGVCLFGVSNLFALDMDTHKFEQHYTTSLVGKLPEAAGRYHAWSPAFHADQISDPLIIFQGGADKVVPPSQSEQIVTALKANGVPHQYIVYEGEGHGFRKSENIANYLKETERFLLTHVLFAP
jgi:dipeptidyl aminopeptidase/acylaminoacyl peptidase